MLFIWNRSFSHSNLLWENPYIFFQFLVVFSFGSVVTEQVIFGGGNLSPFKVPTIYRFGCFEKMILVLECCC